VEKVFYISLAALVFISSTSYAEDADPVRDAFESYKSCIKAEIANGEDVTTQNFKRYCPNELRLVAEHTGEGYGRIKQTIKKWIDIMEQQRKSDG